MILCFELSMTNRASWNGQLHTDGSLSGPDDPTILPTSDTDPDPKKIH